MTAIEYLDQQAKLISNGVVGVSIGRWDDRSTWKVTGTVEAEEYKALVVLFESFEKQTFESTVIQEKTLEERVTALEAKQASYESVK